MSQHELRTLQPESVKLDIPFFGLASLPARAGCMLRYIPWHELAHPAWMKHRLCSKVSPLLAASMNKVEKFSMVSSMTCEMTPTLARNIKSCRGCDQDKHSSQHEAQVSRALSSSIVRVKMVHICGNETDVCPGIRDGCVDCNNVADGSFLAPSVGELGRGKLRLRGLGDAEAEDSHALPGRGLEKNIRRWHVKPLNPSGVIWWGYSFFWLDGDSSLAFVHLHHIRSNFKKGENYWVVVASDLGCITVVVSVTISGVDAPAELCLSSFVDLFSLTLQASGVRVRLPLDEA
eukprot:6033934-Amphidinium_carterae.1